MLKKLRKIKKILFTSIFTLILALSYCSKDFDNFIEITNKPQIIFPECGSAFISGYDNSCCKLTYFYYPDDPDNCEHHKPILMWSPVVGAMSYEVYINGVIYARTSSNQIEINGENPENPATTLSQLAFSNAPYSWFVKAYNDFQIAYSDICYFCLWDDICPEIYLETPANEIYQFEFDDIITISLAVIDKGIIKNITLKDNDVSFSILDENQIGMGNYLSTFDIPSSCDYGKLIKHKLSLCASDMFDNECCKEKEIDVYCKGSFIMPCETEPDVFVVNGPYNAEKVDKPPILTWEKLDCISYYKLHYKKYKDTAEEIVYLEEIDTSFDFSTIINFEQGIYEWILEAYLTTGKVLASDTGSFELKGCQNKSFTNAGCGFPICGTTLDSHIKWNSVQDALFYRLSDGNTDTIAYSNEIPESEIGNFDMNKWYPNFGAKCSVKIMACLEVVPGGVVGDYYHCRCWVESEAVGIVCENAGFDPSNCGKILTGAENCPCTLSKVCDPGYGCSGQFCP